jgi:hypothetical protein
MDFIAEIASRRSHRDTSLQEIVMSRRESGSRDVLGEMLSDADHVDAGADRRDSIDLLARVERLEAELRKVRSLILQTEHQLQLWGCKPRCEPITDATSTS